MKRFHRAWAVCLGCTLMLLVSGGLCINAFSVTQPFILAHNGFTNTQTSMITSVRSVTYLLGMFFTTFYYKKIGYRLGMTLSAVLGAASFALFAAAKTLGGYYLAGAIAGMSYGFGSMVPATILMMRWFRSHRAMAVGLCSAGTGLATVAFSPILTMLIEKYSLRTCFLFESAFCLAAAALVFLLVRADPKSCGSEPYGTAVPESPQLRALHDIHPSPVRWAMLYLSMAFLGAIAGPGFSHMMINFTTAGFSSAAAARAVSIFGFMLMAGKCAYGIVCDGLGAPRTNRIFGAALLLGISGCALVFLKSTAFMYLSAVLYGFGVPLNTVGLSIWATDFSPPELISRRVQRFQLYYAIGTLVFSFMPGAIADLTGSYAPAFALLFGFGVFSLLVVQSTYRLCTKTGAGCR